MTLMKKKYSKEKKEQLTLQKLKQYLCTLLCYEFFRFFVKKRIKKYCSWSFSFVLIYEARWHYILYLLFLLTKYTKNEYTLVNKAL